MYGPRRKDLVPVGEEWPRAARAGLRIPGPQVTTLMAAGDLRPVRGLAVLPPVCNAAKPPPGKPGAQRTGVQRKGSILQRHLSGSAS